MNDEISVIIKDPGRNPLHVNISNHWSNLQKTVGDFLNVRAIANDLAIISAEFGELQDKEACCTVGGVQFFGTVIFAGLRIDKQRHTYDFGDIPLTFDQFKKSFPQLWESQKENKK